MSTSEEETADALIGLAMVPVTIVFGGFVLMRLWAWHIVPVFGLPSLTLGHAIGVDLVVVLLRGIHSNKKDDDRSASTAAFTSLFVHAIFLLVGWLAR